MLIFWFKNNVVFIGENPTCVFPLFQAFGLKFTPLWRFASKGISPVATGDQRYARWISASFLKKA
jgi:hypothetical protein